MELAGAPSRHRVEPARPQPRFEDLTRKEAFNLGRAVGHYQETVRVRQSADGRVLIVTRLGQEVGIADLLDISRTLANSLK